MSDIDQQRYRRSGRSWAHRYCREYPLPNKPRARQRLQRKHDSPTRPGAKNVPSAACQDNPRYRTSSIAWCHRRGSRSRFDQRSIRRRIARMSARWPQRPRHRPSIAIAHRDAVRRLRAGLPQATAKAPAVASSSHSPNSTSTPLRHRSAQHSCWNRRNPPRYNALLAYRPIPTKNFPGIPAVPDLRWRKHSRRQRRGAGPRRWSRRPHTYAPMSTATPTARRAALVPISIDPFAFSPTRPSRCFLFRQSGQSITNASVGSPSPAYRSGIHIVALRLGTKPLSAQNLQAHTDAKTETVSTEKCPLDCL